MPRLARLDAPGILHHVMIRGIERRKIFRDDKDRENILDRLSIFLPQTKTTCYAWALMSNHAHFLFRTGDTGISSIMMKLLTGYAVYFNRRHKRHGQLFQNRYKSIICQEDQYLIELIRYIHLNPLRAKLVEGISELDKYPYSGHSALTGKCKREWQEVNYILKLFGRGTEEAKRRYINYIKEGIDQGRRPELVGGGLIRSLGGWEEVKKIRLSGQDRIKGDQLILGESDFVMSVLAEANEKYERFYELKRKGYDLKKVEEKITEMYGIEKSDIYTRGRRKVQAEARSVFCYWAVCELGMNRTFMVKLFDMTQPGVGYAVNRGEKIAKENGFQLIP